MNQQNMGSCFSSLLAHLVVLQIRDSDISSASTRANSTSENEATTEDQIETDDQTSQSEIEEISIVKGINTPKKSTFLKIQIIQQSHLHHQTPWLQQTRLLDIICDDDLHRPDELDMNTQRPDVTIISNILTSRDIANQLIRTCTTGRSFRLTIIILLI